MRIIAGKHRGRQLVSFRQEGVRPTSDKAREALFNILAPDLPGAFFLDMFCGTGAVGLEAMSRGAGKVVFNDLSRESLRILRRNLAMLGEEAEVHNLDFRALAGSLRERFDIIYIDPPYKSGYGGKALEAVASHGLLREGGIAVLESDTPFSGDAKGFVRRGERRYGIAWLTFFGWEEADSCGETGGDGGEK